MTTAWKSMLALVRVGVITVAMTACGLSTHYPIPPGPVTTLIPGWERDFALEWTVEPEGDGTRRLDGYVTNRYGEYAADIRLLVQGLDASGAVVSRHIAWGPNGVGGFGRAYFEIRHLPAAHQYQVFVWDYRRIESASLLR